MRRFYTLFAGALLAGSLAAGCAGGAAAEKNSLQGNWLLTGTTFGGKSMALATGTVPGSVVYSFTSDKLIIKVPGVKSDEQNYTIDASKKPKHLDLANGKAAIYALEGDVLKIGFNF